MNKGLLLALVFYLKNLSLTVRGTARHKLQVLKKTVPSDSLRKLPNLTVTS